MEKELGANEYRFNPKMAHVCFLEYMHGENYWVAVKELNLSYYNWGTRLRNYYIVTYYGDLI